MLSNKEVMEALLAGKKIRNVHTSGPGEYFMLDEYGAMVDETGSDSLEWDLQYDEVELYTPEPVEVTEKLLRTLWLEMYDEGMAKHPINSNTFPTLLKKLGLK